MKLVIKEGIDIKDPLVTIECKQIDSFVQKLIKRIELIDNFIMGSNAGKVYRIAYNDIYYFECVERKYFAYCEKDMYEIEYKIYELEYILNRTQFVRISKTTILNIDYLKYVKVITKGRMEGTLLNGENVIISRRYIAELKKVLKGAENG